MGGCEWAVVSHDGSDLRIGMEIGAVRGLCHHRLQASEPSRFHAAGRSCEHGAVTSCPAPLFKSSPVDYRCGHGCQCHLAVNK